MSGGMRAARRETAVLPQGFWSIARWCVLAAPRVEVGPVLAACGACLKAVCDVGRARDTCLGYDDGETAWADDDNDDDDGDQLFRSPVRAWRGALGSLSRQALTMMAAGDDEGQEAAAAALSVVEAVMRVNVRNECECCESRTMTLLDAAEDDGVDGINDALARVVATGMQSERFLAVAARIGALAGRADEVLVPMGAYVDVNRACAALAAEAALDASVRFDIVRTLDTSECVVPSEFMPALLSVTWFMQLHAAHDSSTSAPFATRFYLSNALSLLHASLADGSVIADEDAGLFASAVGTALRRRHGEEENYRRAVACAVDGLRSPVLATALAAEGAVRSMVVPPPKEWWSSEVDAGVAAVLRSSARDLVVGADDVAALRACVVGRLLGECSSICRRVAEGASISTDFREVGVWATLHALLDVADGDEVVPRAVLGGLGRLRRPRPSRRVSSSRASGPPETKAYEALGIMLRCCIAARESAWERVLGRGAAPTRGRRVDQGGGHREARGRRDGSRGARSAAPPRRRDAHCRGDGACRAEDAALVRGQDGGSVA
jgi:hypothetical protein